MKLVKSLLLGSAAGLCAVAGAQAADLPVRKAAPVEFVRVCSAYGVGFFYIPGTDTCLRVSGRAQFAYQFTTTRAYSGALASGDVSGYRGLGRVQFDARTQTAYGTLRTFVRMDIWSNTGGYLTSGTAQRFAGALPGFGPDTFGRAQKYIEVDKAFIQFAGLTAGRASSFYDFYAHDFEYIGASQASDVPSTNLLAYTATFGGGFSATISMEDPTFRRQPVYAPFVNALATGTAAGGQGTALSSALFSNLGLVAGNFVTPVTVAVDAAGNPTAFRLLDTTQRNRVPDVVAALRVDQAWGSAQISGAMHEVSIGKYAAGVFNTGVGAAGTATGFGGVFGAANTTIAGAVANVREPSSRYGFAVQGGVKFNLPMIAAGDAVYLQAAYSQGAISYTGASRQSGYEAVAVPFSGKLTFTPDDAFVDSSGRLRLTEAFSAVGSFLHYFTPQVRGAIHASYSHIDFPGNALVNSVGPTNLALLPNTAGTGGRFAQTALRDFDTYIFGGNLTWSPVRDLDIGVEVLYARGELSSGTATNANRPGTFTRSDDVVMTRFRIQRDF